MEVYNSNNMLLCIFLAFCSQGLVLYEKHLILYIFDINI